MIRTVVRLVVLVVSAAAGGATAHALEAPVAAGGVAGALAGGAAVLLEIVAASLPIERLVWGVAGGLAGLGVGNHWPSRSSKAISTSSRSTATCFRTNGS